MRPLRLTLVPACALLLLAGASAAVTPNPDGIVFETRIFNDCPTSILTTTDLYPTEIEIQDENEVCGGFANLHAWRLAVGGTAADFPNASAFHICATLAITGTGEAEAGLQIAPWWSQSDGRFNVRSTDGEVACFGGRLPFYSFTSSHGVVYTKGDPIQLCLTYRPHGLSESDPATIVYDLTYGGSDYSSGPLPFDQGNPAEDPPYGLWGILNQAQVGGFVQYFLTQGTPPHSVNAKWSDVSFQALTVAVENSTWGRVKGMFR